jgi:peptide/nickel transport system substrate-binding protein
MNRLINRTIAVAALILLLPCLGALPSIGSAQTRVSVGVTETMETYNPYGDSVSLLYTIWCQIMGCLVGYDFDKGEYVGVLAERWEVKTPNTWIFHLRKNLRFHDGSPVTAADVVHSVNRIGTDPQSKQTQNIAPIAGVEAIDRNTVRITTKEATAPLLEFFSDKFYITSKAIYDKYGPEVGDRKYPIGAGPYKFKELLPGQRFVIVKNTEHPDVKKNPQAPDELIFRVMREPEQRITALLNNEIQIAQFVPPHLRGRVEGNPNTKIVTVDSLEIMFLAMSPKFKPWDNTLLRQAVGYAIDRDTIIGTILKGQATRLDGPIGPGQYGYDAKLKPRYEFNPEKARQLVKQAGFANGVDVELATPVNRYILDKQISEAMVPMLNAVGIRAKLLTPEWATLWANVQQGKVPFYYMGRGGIIDPSPAIQQYFETGGSPRIGYSNPKLDKLLAQERQTFDPAKRKRVLSQAMSLITEEAPAHFLWRHQLTDGISKNIEYKARPDSRVFGLNIKVLR